MIDTLPHILICKIFNSCFVMDRLQLASTCKLLRDTKFLVLDFIRFDGQSDQLPDIVECYTDYEVNMQDYKKFLEFLEKCKHRRIESLALTDVDDTLNQQSLPDCITSLTIVSDKIWKPSQSFILPHTLTSVSIMVGDVSANRWRIPKNAIRNTVIQRLSIAGLGFAEKLEPGDLPSTLVHANFSLDQPLERGLLPNGIQRLSLYHYTYPILPNTLPQGLCQLSLPENFSHPFIAGSLPSSVDTLSVFKVKTIMPFTLPARLGDLSILGRIGSHLQASAFPYNLYNLHIDSYDFPLDPGVLTGTRLIQLHITSFNQQLQPNVFPPTLKGLTLTSYNQPLVAGVLPSGLTTLQLIHFNQPLTPGVLPDTLDSLELRHFNQPIQPNTFPDSLNDLAFFDSFNHPLGPGMLPRNLKGLALGTDYSHEIDEGVIPDTVEEVRIIGLLREGHKYIFPQSVQTIIIDYKDNDITRLTIHPTTTVTFTDEDDYFDY